MGCHVYMAEGFKEDALMYMNFPSYNRVFSGGRRAEDGKKIKPSRGK
jgi:hypothetical protein